MEQRRKRTRSQQGFTLIELMVVLVILGMLAGSIGFSVFNQKRDADIRTARLDIQALSQAVEVYRVKHSTLPESLEQLVPGEVARLRKDPWGNGYVFSHTGDNFQILSYGPDKSQGGGDDVLEESNVNGSSRS